MTLPVEFHDRLHRVAFRQGVTPEQAEAFTRAYATLSPLEAARINPPLLARRAGLAEDTALTLLVAGARDGLFSFEWGLVCPGCGGFAHTMDTISGVTDDFHCGFCDMTTATTLDETVEVTFACPSTSFDPLADLREHACYHTSQSYPYQAEMAAYHERNTVAEARIAPGQTAELRFTARPGETYRLITLENHSSYTLEVAEGGEAVLDVVADHSGFCGVNPILKPGPVRLGLTNRLEDRVWVQVIRRAPEEIAAYSSAGLPPQPRLSGKSLLTNQTFRDLFGIQELIPDLHIRVQAITLLFTDLKGSTELYDRAGDLPAYDLVQKHFQILRQAVQAHSGAIVKTMGDAIMAAFSDPVQAAQAAVAMMQGIRALSEDWKPEQPGLKIGLHTGPALTVNTGGALDFFGQTVNIAARVQGLADAGEIVLSTAVQAAGPQIPALLRDSGYHLTPETSRLKGVAQAHGVIRCRPGDAPAADSGRTGGFLSRLLRGK
ncbi:adenylate/guanylate cyclase domain-containing protein [Novispirillum itersonii]|uniref:Class 3 adenylate cyclase n=1 Tax=Novispirillum itersonii TaxID=189 RepID=A0A7W9ZG97_NOVIT|nr:adenylate/guanylate cyclase domain-containing protein [Novispirillum itersonii]MBB6210880.1 class 3 adenylate cyclase [Novispirillum itersonii]